MIDKRIGGEIIIWSSIFVSMVLVTMPMPQVFPLEFGFLRPDWVLMFLIYWIIALPHRVGVLTAWLSGVLVDVLSGCLLGQHALAYVIISYAASNLYQRLRMFSVWQQAIVVLIFLVINQLTEFWIETILGFAEWKWWYLSPALSGAFLWPWVFLILRLVRRRTNMT